MYFCQFKQLKKINVHFFLVAIDLILFNIANKKERYDILDEF